jgi:amino acid transporter
MTSSRITGDLGTFAGVFTPSILTILGLILFLRLGYVVGAAGLGLALLILVAANAISLLTSLSLSAVATNLRIKRGGDYYLISRTLGHEFGGAIGLVLFLAQAVSIGFYCIGFGEAMAAVLPSPLDRHGHIFATGAAGVLFVFAWMGADWATRFQYVVMAVLTAALVSYFAGGLLLWDSALLQENWSAPGDGETFWVLFALFFPAVTGFTQGVSMSGDLRDPGRSLPLGTLTAVGLSIVVYLLTAVVFAGALPRDDLVRDYEAMNRVALVPGFIVAGVFAATLSSGMASFMGAPRILQSLASDRLFPWLLPFASGTGRARNPRRGVLLSAAIAFATISLGQLNLIAPIVSMFFLISYGLINYATWFEASSASPSFRPTFRFYHRHLSLAGALACLGTMLAIDIEAGLIAVAVLFAVYQYLRRIAPQARWADGRRSFHTQRVRTHLLAAVQESDHPRDWRPNILLFSDDAPRRARLLRFASWLERDSGFTTAVRILVGHGGAMLQRKHEAEEMLAQEIKEAGVQAFPLAVATPDLDTGVNVLVQGFGIAHLRANIILLDWLEHEEEKTAAERRELVYGRNLKTAFRLGSNLVMLAGGDSDWKTLQEVPRDERRIDVWWRDDATSRLMLLLAYLMTGTEDWEGARIRLLGICCTTASTGTAEALGELLENVRIQAEPVLLEQDGPEAVAEHSADASLVFLPFRLHGTQPLGPFDTPIDTLLEPLPVTALVLASEDIDLDAEPEEGAAGEAARLLDALADAERLAELTARDAETSISAAREKREKLEAAVEKQESEEVIEDMTDDLRELEKQADTARRRAERLAARAQAARNEAESLGALPRQNGNEQGD